MFREPSWINEVDAHTRNMVLQYGRMYDDIEWSLIRYQQDLGDPELDPVLNAVVYAARSAMGEAAEWLAIEGYHLRKESPDVAVSPIQIKVAEWGVHRAIAKLECAYSIISKVYVALAAAGILRPKHKLEGPSAKPIQDLIDLAKAPWEHVQHES